MKLFIRILYSSFREMATEKLPRNQGLTQADSPLTNIIGWTAFSAIIAGRSLQGFKMQCWK